MPMKPMRELMLHILKRYKASIVELVVGNDANDSVTPTIDEASIDECQGNLNKALIIFMGMDRASQLT